MQKLRWTFQGFSNIIFQGPELGFNCKLKDNIDPKFLMCLKEKEKGKP